MTPGNKVKLDILPKRRFSHPPARNRAYRSPYLPPQARSRQNDRSARPGHPSGPTHLCTLSSRVHALLWTSRKQSSSQSRVFVGLLIISEQKKPTVFSGWVIPEQTAFYRNTVFWGHPCTKCCRAWPAHLQKKSPCLGGLVHPRKKNDRAWGVGSSQKKIQTTSSLPCSVTLASGRGSREAAYGVLNPTYMGQNTRFALTSQTKIHCKKKKKTSTKIAIS
ncbi:unnamed protein product, partial [Ectocarpus sp. 8 AP-2014]